MEAPETALNPKAVRNKIPRQALTPTFHRNK